MAYNANSSSSSIRNKLKWGALPAAAAVLALGGCTTQSSEASSPDAPAAIPAASAPVSAEPTAEAPQKVQPFSALRKISKSGDTVFVRPFSFGTVVLEGGFEGVLTCSGNDAVALDRMGNVHFSQTDVDFCDNQEVNRSETAAVIALVGGQQAPDTL